MKLIAVMMQMRILKCQQRVFLPLMSEQQDTRKHQNIAKIISSITIKQLSKIKQNLMHSEPEVSKNILL